MLLQKNKDTGAASIAPMTNVKLNKNMRKIIEKQCLKEQLKQHTIMNKGSLQVNEVRQILFF